MKIWHSKRSLRLSEKPDNRRSNTPTNRLRLASLICCEDVNFSRRFTFARNGRQLENDGVSCDRLLRGKCRQNFARKSGHPRNYRNKRVRNRSLPFASVNRQLPSQNTTRRMQTEVKTLEDIIARRSAARTGAYSKYSSRTEGLKTVVRSACTQSCRHLDLVLDHTTTRSHASSTRSRVSKRQVFVQSKRHRHTICEHGLCLQTHRFFTHS